MEPTIEIFPSKTFVGLRQTVTITTDNPVALWRPFRMSMKEIGNGIFDKLYSIQDFDGVDFSNFTANTEFQKWAAIEVTEAKHIPTGMEVLEMPQGKYAIFIHKGTPATFKKTTDYIFGEWLPNSGFELDNRPHLSIMSKDYRPDDAAAKELVCIPVKP